MVTDHPVSLKFLTPYHETTVLDALIYVFVVNNDQCITLYQWGAEIPAPRGKSGALGRGAANLSCSNSSGNFRSKGVNDTSFTIPPRVFPIPHVRRLALVFQNLGNWSSFYSLEGYSFVTPIVGLFAYDASHISSNGFKRINLNVQGDPILVHFPQIVLPEHAKFTLKCVQYGVNEPAKISEMNTSNLCFTRVQGHFSIVTPLMEPKIVAKKNKKETLWKCWVVGFALAFIGLVTAASVVMMMIRYLKCKKVEEMEKQSDGAEAFNYVWIGDCKMPSAATLRTQPILENREVL
ncbi:hypothetical protein Sjap_005197 [Stephania japonica]|uniref:Uncharacterized protein n=1 Tax=Stephania japonica TaxID=461633 RepID=A0AAP0K4Y7_9MAGN